MKPVVVALLVACSGPPPSNVPIGSQATPGARPAIADATLAVLEPEGGECVLRRIDPIAKQSDAIARMPGDCLGGRIAWHPRFERAVVWFEPGNLYTTIDPRIPGGHRPDDDERKLDERVFELDLVAGTAKRVTLPASDRPREIAYAADGELYMFAEEDVPKASGKMTVRGHEVDFSDIADGMPAVALAFRRAGTRWKLASVTVTTTGWDYAAGWRAAPEAKHAGPRSDDLLSPHPDDKEIADRAMLTALHAIAKPATDANAWVAVGPLFVWTMIAEFQFATGRIAWRDGDRIAPLPQLDFTEGDLVGIAFRGDFIAIASSTAGAYPRVYQLSTKRRIWASDTARVATFWPR